MSDNATPDASLLDLTTLIVTNHVSHNAVHASDLSKLITSVHSALAALGTAAPSAVAEERYEPAVSVRKSLASDDHIISMIDGKPYRTLRRHLGTHGLTDKEYRARYNLPADYPMVAKAYSAARKAMAQAIGLGRKAGGRVAAAAGAAEGKVEEVAAPAVAKAKRGARKVASQIEEVAKPITRRRRKSAGG